MLNVSNCKFAPIKPDKTKGSKYQTNDSGFSKIASYVIRSFASENVFYLYPHQL